MKAFVCLVMFAALNVALCENEMCSKRASQICASEARRLNGIPQTVEEMTEACKVLQDVAICALNYYEICDENEDHGERRMFKYIQEKCREDTPEFQAISNKLNCFTSNVDNNEKECKEFHRDVLTDLYIQASNISNSPEDLYCYNAFYKVTCNSEMMGKKCGMELIPVVLELMENVHALYIENCNEEIVAKFAPLKPQIEQLVHGSRATDSSEEEESDEK